MIHRHRSFSSFVPLVLGALMLAAAVAPAAATTASRPSVRLIASSTEITAYRYDPEGPVYLTPGVLLAAVRGAFDIRVRRVDYDHPITATQVIHRADGVSERQLPSWVVARGFRGMTRFLHAVMRDRNGNVVLDSFRNFCPAGEDMRVNPNSPTRSEYPRRCDAGAFALGRVWGIERGWATSAFGWSGLKANVPNGRYELRVSIPNRYRELFGIPAQDAAVSVTVRVRDADMGCGEGPCPGRTGADGAVGTRGPLGYAPSVADPTQDSLPDLISLPAWNIVYRPGADRDFIEFAATVWNAGPAPLLVEGYRSAGEDTMDAYQYFVRDGEIVGRSRVGNMEYDPRHGHEHWHFKQFARYSLLDASKQRAVVSGKEAFCLAPTDAIDLTAPGAEWNPGSTGLGTACGGPTAIWVRETLQAGWGDTYYQTLPGQSLEITGLPNGTYYVAVDANPRGLLFERSAANNRELREIRLGGTPGNRTLTVMPWHGIEI